MAHTTCPSWRQTKETEVNHIQPSENVESETISFWNYMHSKAPQTQTIPALSLFEVDAPWSFSSDSWSSFFCSLFISVRFLLSSVSGLLRPETELPGHRTRTEGRLSVAHSRKSKHLWEEHAQVKSLYFLRNCKRHDFPWNDLLLRYSQTST